MKKDIIIPFVFELSFILAFYIIPDAATVGGVLLFYINEGFIRNYIRKGRISLNEAISSCIEDFMPIIISFSIFFSVFLIEYWAMSIYSTTSTIKFIIQSILIVLYVILYPIMNAITRSIIHEHNYAIAFYDTWCEIRNNKKETLEIYILSIIIFLPMFIPVIGKYFVLPAIVVLDFMPIIYHIMKIRKFKARKHQHQKAQ